MTPGLTQKASPSARRVAVAIVGLAAIAGAVLIAIATRFRPALEAWVGQDLGVRIRIVGLAATIFTSGPLVGLAAYLWHFGKRVVRDGRYPPTGAALIRDTLVLTGPAAHRRGRLIQVTAGALGLAALLLAVFFWRFVFSLIGPVPGWALSSGYTLLDSALPSAPGRARPATRRASRRA